MKAFCKWLLCGVMGWKMNISQPIPEKKVICLAPHTSNWDFIIGMLFSKAVGLKSNFLMKREWFIGPLGTLFRHWGGIPVWRDKHTSMTDVLANEAKKAKTFSLCITPEGTRSLNPDWKLGFYYIALKAGIPILLFGLDYPSKTIICTKTIIPSGDVDSDMRTVKLYYKDMKGKNPKLFSVGKL